MAGNGGRIQIGIDYKLNKTGLNDLKQTLQEVQKQLTAMGSGKNGPSKEIETTVKAAQQLESILNDSWNSKLSQLDLNKVNTGIKSTFGTVQNLKSQMEASGATGSAAYNKVASAVLNTNLQLKQSNKLLDDMATTMANTVKWGITSSIFNKMTGSIQEAWGYTKRLDSSLNDIRIVTEKSAEAMQQFAREANSAAKSLGSSTTDYTEASLIYFQQGLSDEEVAARAQTTIKAANVTGQSAEEVSEQLTAVWNGYKVSAQEAEVYVDKLAAVAATTAADLEELSTGMSKVASAANSMGVDIDQLNAQLATIVSVTRQAPESVGTALKTIYARLGDLAIEGEDEFGTSLGTVSAQMEQMGIAILDEQGQMREMGEVIEETAAKWETWSEAQRQAAAVAMAGKRQYNNLIALFDNWDMYTESLNTSVDATGTLQKQQDIYMESVSAHLAQMKTEAEKTYDILFDEELVKNFIDITTGALSVFNNYIEGLGGGVGTLIGLGSVVANLFHKQIGKALSSQLNNLQQFKDNARAIDLKEQFLKQGIADNHALKGEEIGSEGVQKEFEIASRLLEVRGALTQEQYNELTQMQQQVGLTENQIQYLSKSRDIAEQVFDTEFATVQDFEERLELEEESLENRKQQLATVDRELNLYEKMREDSGYTDDDSQYLFDRVEALKAIADSQEEFNLLEEASGNIAVKNALTDEQRQAIINAQNRLLDNQQREVNLIRQGLEGAQAVEDGTLDTLREQQRVREDIINQQIRQAERQELINDAVKGMTLLVNVGASLLGIIQTLNDEDLSFEEKLKQTATVLAATLPMLISNFNSLKSIFPGIKTGLTQLVVAYGDTAAAASASSQLASGATMGLGASIKALLPAIGSFMVAASPYILIIGAIAAAVYACVKAYNADAEAAEKAAEASKEAAEAADEAREAYEKLADAFGAYNEAVKKLEELLKTTEDLAEGTEEYEEALKAANEEAMNLIKSNNNLAKYAKRDNRGLITFKGAEAEIEAARNKASLTGAASNLSQIKANEAQLVSNTTNFQRVVKDANVGNPYISEKEISSLIDYINSNNGSITNNEIRTLVEGFGIEMKPVQEDLIMALQETTPELIALAEETKNLNATNQLLLEDSLRTGLGTNADYVALNSSQQNAVAALYGQGLTEDQINNIRSKAEETYKDVLGGKDEKKVHEEYAKARGWSISKDKAGKAIYVDNEGNEQTITDDSARAYLTNLKVAEDMAKYDQASLDTIISAVTKVSEGGATFDENIASELLGFATKEDTEFDSSKLSLSMFDKLKEEDNLEEAFSGLSDEEWAKLDYENVTEFANAVRETLTPELRAAIEDSTREALGALSDSANTLVTEMLEGNLDIAALGESEEYQSIIARLEDIKELYPELTEEAETFANKSLLGTQMWSESLYEIKDALNQIELEELEENYEKALEDMKTDAEGNPIEFNTWLNSEEFETELDAILDADYAINIEIHSQAEEAFEATSKAIENIKAEASKIGESYIVAGEDIRELNNVFPGILQNAIDLRNGTIQLNEDIVKSAVATAQSEVIADVESTNKKLVNSATQLRAKQENYQAMADAAYALATSETILDEETSKNEAIIQDGLNAMREESNNAELDDQALIATNAGENAKIMASNWANAYEQAALMAKQFADDAVAAAQVAQAGVGSVDIGGYNVNYQGQTGESAEATQLDKYQDLANKGDSDSYAKLSAAFQAAADAAGKQANDIEGMMIESAAILQDFTFGSLGIATGEGFKDAEDTVDKTNQKEAETAELLEDVYDRYREINIQLSLLETNLGRVQKQEEKLAGKAYIDNLQQQLEILDKQVEADKEKLSLTQQETQELMATLSQYGAQFNEAGQVTNYREVMDSALAKANAVINTYNSLSAEEQETYKATMEAAIASYEALDETFQRFDELYTEEIPGLVDTIQKELDQAIELKIEQFNTKIQVDLDLKEAERQWNDFYAEIVKGIKDDNLVGQSELAITQLGTYTSKEGEPKDTSTTLAKDLERLTFLNSQANQILSSGWSDTYGDNITALLEDLGEANNQLIDDMSSAKELADSVYENYLASIDKVIEGNDSVIKQYEFLGELLDHNQKIIELLSGESKASELTGYYAERNALNQQTIEEHAKNAQYYQEMMDSIDDKTSEEWKKWSEAWQNEVSSLNAAIIQGMEDAAAAYTNAIELAMQEMESAFTDGLGFEYIQDEWDLTNENAEKYLDTINSAYEISKLENKFVDAINDTSSLASQKKLTAAMEQEIKLLEEADQISQYDIDRANLKYELTLKQIALEEAQANKTSMRLRRDAQGNYGYVFAADEDEIAKAQQELADAENELYNFDKEAYNEKIESVLKAEQDLQSKLQEIWTNENLSEEQKLQYSTMINKQYRDIIETDIEESEKAKQNLSADTLNILSKYYDEELSKARETFNNTDKANAIAVKNMQERFKNLPSSFDNILTAWGDGASTGVSGKVQTNVDILLENMQLSFNTSVANIASRFQKKSSGDGSLQAAIEDSLDKCKNASINFQTTIENVAKAAGVAFSGEDGTGGLTGKTKSLKDIMEGLLSLTNQYATTITGEEGTLTAAQNLSEAYSIQYKQVKDLNDSISSYNTYLSSLAEEAEKATKETQNLTVALKEQYEAKKAIENKSSGVSSSEAVNEAKENKSSGNSNSSSSSQPAPAPAPSKSLADAYDYINSGQAGNGKSRAENMAAAGFTPEQIAQAQSMINEAYGKGMTADQIKNKYNAYDTGGYTGDWNSSEGRLALLHEKEIVLNKADTANILDVVSMVREMTSSSLRGANGMMSGMMEALASVTNNSTNSRQEIHITAEFPNATSVADIEEAFRSLPNIASQYAFSF